MCYSIFSTSPLLPSPRSSNSFLLAPSTEVYQVHYSSYTFEERCFLSISIPENLNSMSCRQTKHNAIAECSRDSRLRERCRGHRVCHWGHQHSQQVSGTRATDYQTLVRMSPVFRLRQAKTYSLKSHCVISACMKWNARGSCLGTRTSAASFYTETRCCLSGCVREKDRWQVRTAAAD